MFETDLLRRALVACNPGWDELMDPFDAPAGTVLSPASALPREAYLLISGLASIRYDMTGGYEADDEVAVAMVGRDGVTGSQALASPDPLPFRCIAETDVAGFAVSTQAARRIADHCPSSRRLIDRYHHHLALEQAFNLAAAARLSIPRRLALWLLQAAYLSRSDALHVSQTRIAGLIGGARRPSVTDAANALAREGLIAKRKGLVSIADEEGLARLAGRPFADWKTQRTFLVSELERFAYRPGPRAIRVTG